MRLRTANRHAKRAEQARVFTDRVAGWGPVVWPYPMRIMSVAEMIETYGRGP